MRPKHIYHTGGALWLVVGGGSMLLAVTVHLGFLAVTALAFLLLQFWAWCQHCPHCGARLVEGTYPLVGPLARTTCRRCKGPL